MSGTLSRKQKHIYCSGRVLIVVRLNEIIRYISETEIKHPGIYQHPENLKAAGII